MKCVPTNTKDALFKFSFNAGATWDTGDSIYRVDYFRYKDVNNYYSLITYYNPGDDEPYFTIIKKVNGVQTLLYNIYWAVWDGEWYPWTGITTPKIRILNNEIKFYVNNELMTTLTDSSLNQGGELSKLCFKYLLRINKKGV